MFGLAVEDSTRVLSAASMKVVVVAGERGTANRGSAESWLKGASDASSEGSRRVELRMRPRKEFEWQCGR